MMETSIVDELATKRRRLDAFIVFHRSLRDIGLDVKSLIHMEQGNVPDQYVAAAILSYREIDNTDLRIMHLAKERIRVWQMMNKQFNLQKRQFRFSFKRIIVLFNTKSPCEHGEARLFDYDCIIRNEICDLTRNFNSTCRMNYYEILRRQFFDEFGMNEKYVWCMFTHFIPCTLPQHMCSKLLQEFASRNNEQLIVSYFKAYNLTSANTAWNQMKTSKHVYCLHSNDVRFSITKTNQIVWDREEATAKAIEEDIDMTLNEEESLENYLKCPRQVRSLLKRKNFRDGKCFGKDFLLNSQHYRN